MVLNSIASYPSSMHDVNKTPLEKTSFEEQIAKISSKGTKLAQSQGLQKLPMEGNFCMDATGRIDPCPAELNGAPAQNAAPQPNNGQLVPVPMPSSLPIQGQYPQGTQSQERLYPTHQLPPPPPLVGGASSTLLPLPRVGTPPTGGALEAYPEQEFIQPPPLANMTP
jgi:hypothetical protein